MRSFDRSMPEELNRVLADHAGDLLLCSTATAVANLEREGVAGGVQLVGDVMADVSLAFASAAEERSHALEDHGVEPGAYLLVTAHRAGNVDDPARLELLVELLEALPRPAVFPSTPARGPARDRRPARAAGAAPRLRLAPPLGYLDFLTLARARPRHAHGLGRGAEGGLPARTPCVTLRETPSGWRRWSSAGTCWWTWIATGRARGRSSAHCRRGSAGSSTAASTMPPRRICDDALHIHSRARIDHPHRRGGAGVLGSQSRTQLRPPAGAELSWICDQSEEALARGRRASRSARASGDLDEVLADPGPGRRGGGHACALACGRGHARARGRQALLRGEAAGAVGGGRRAVVPPRARRGRC